MNNLYIIIPAYNEEANIESCVNAWYPIVEKHAGGGASRLVVIDDGSKDNTYSILQQLSKDRPLLVPITKENGGHGATVLFGYQYAIDRQADYIFQTDSDGQTDPSEFEAFWQQRNQFDGIFGRRDNRGDGRARAFVEKTVCFLLRVYFGVKIPDANAPFRLMKAKVVEKYIHKMKPDYNLPNIMITTYFVYYHEKYTFVPISFQPRQGGVNSINIPKIVGIGRKALRDFRELKKGM